MSPNFVGVWIPREVFTHKDLSPNAKFLYGIIDALDNEEGCYASNGFLASNLGLSERQVRLLVSQLEKLGLVERLEGQNNGRVLRTVSHIALNEAIMGGGNKLPRGRKKTSAGGGKKLPPYNIEDNIEDKDTLAPKKKEPILTLLPYMGDAFSKAWEQWIAYRKEIKRPLKPSTITMQLDDLSKLGEDNAIASIHQSIKNGWQGLFPPQKSVVVMQSKTLTNKDHSQF